MLVQFNFKNFKSYKYEVSLDMKATSVKEHPYNVIDKGHSESYLKVAAIYGANASGKTGVIDAFDFMRYFVLESFQMASQTKEIPIKRFAFDKSGKDAVSEFEVFFVKDGMEYQYGFIIDDKKVHGEWLYNKEVGNRKKFKILFERKNKNINCSESLKNARELVNMIEEKTLFLSFISNARIDEAKTVNDWFTETKVMDFGHIVKSFFAGHSWMLNVENLKNEKYKEELEKFLKAVDVGIEGISIEEFKDIFYREGEKGIRVFCKHKDINDDTYQKIPLDDESSGTQKLFVLYKYLMDCLREGKTLFVDELDAKLHPLLLRYIINMFHNPEINKSGGQLIYTTHDTCTLTKETFRRDQIWFTEKNEFGVSSLYSLAEYKLDDDKKVRNDASYSKDYLSGRYGAVPLLKEFGFLGGQQFGK